MRGSAAPGRRRLRMQLRISNMRAPYGRTFWSEPLQLDSLGGAAIVSVPCPGPSPSYAQPDARAAYALSVTASQVANIAQTVRAGTKVSTKTACMALQMQINIRKSCSACRDDPSLEHVSLLEHASACGSAEDVHRGRLLQRCSHCKLRTSTEACL